MIHFLSTCLILAFCSSFVSSNPIWSIGKADKSAGEFALAPKGYEDFIERDFGYEDGYYLVGHSLEKEDFPYVLPGPADTWGGTWNTAGWRTHQVNVLFSLDKAPEDDCVLKVNLADFSKRFLPLVKVSVNDLGKRYGRGEKFVIKAHNASRKNIYVQSAVLNGRELNSFSFPASELLKGGELILEMGPVPNKNWGIE